MLEAPAPAAAEKVVWSDVKKVAEQAAKQATTVGLVDKDGIDEATKSYVHTLQALILLAHGSTVGAGPTLVAAVRLPVGQILESSLSLLELVVSLAVKGASKGEREAVLPRSVGQVWEACESLMKAPWDNRVAIGRGLVQTAATMKDVVRELSEAKADSGVQDTGLTSLSLEQTAEEEADDDSEYDFSQGFSEEELDVVKACIAVMESLIVVVKQLVYVVADKSTELDVKGMESLLELCKGLGIHVDELGASLYPPQELERLRDRSRQIEGGLERVEIAVSNRDGGAPEDLRSACRKALELLALFTQKLQS